MQQVSESDQGKGGGSHLAWFGAPARCRGTGGYVEVGVVDGHLPAG